jgi:hypothetical protein
MKSKVTINRNGTVTTKFIAISDTEGTISGAKTANLKVSLTTLDTHEYKCRVTDAEGNQVTSEVITLTVDSESGGGRVSIPTSGKTGNLD